MDPITTDIQVRSFNCEGCDCGACAGDAVASLEDASGVIHVRLDRRRTTFVVRFDPAIVTRDALVAYVEAARVQV